jgi:hypothetical protein
MITMLVMTAIVTLLRLALSSMMPLRRSRTIVAGHARALEVADLALFG